MNSVFKKIHNERTSFVFITYVRYRLCIFLIEKKTMENVYTFTAAVRGYHHHRKFWKPKENKTLQCLFEKDNLYDHFAIKTVSSDGKTVGHLPREISRVTKFFLDRGARVNAKLTSRHYRRSPLVQGGM